MPRICVMILSWFFIPCCFAQSSNPNDSTILPGSFNKIAVVTDSAKAYFSIYPNPAKNKITLQVTGFIPGMAVVKITDTKGKIWRADNRLLTNGTEEMTIFLMLPTGIYFMEINQKKKMARKKLVII